MGLQQMSTQFSIRLDDDLENRLEDFRQAQLIEPSKSDVIRQALHEFLEQEGF